VGNQSDSFIILGIFVFLGVFAFFGSMMFLSIPDSSLNSVNMTKPTMPTNDANQSIFSYIGYASTTVGSLATTNPLVLAVIVIPFLAVLAFILAKLIKPFGS
jgi:hypothetical protein